MTAANLPMSTGGYFGTSTDKGVGPDARVIRERILGVLKDFYQSVYISQIHADAHRQLLDVVAEASKGNWDGYGARAVSLRTAQNALCLLRSLPSGVPSPEVAADPDGGIAFEWTSKPDRSFSVSVGEDDVVAYAGLAGRRRVHGTETFIDQLPVSLLQGLGRTLAL